MDRPVICIKVYLCSSQVPTKNNAYIIFFVFLCNELSFRSEKEFMYFFKPRESNTEEKRELFFQG